ncbi:MAG: Ig-like domain-containing protein, partial [Verrucomicrobia bacterium]|nr:Ig-like domain-containing protein [Verrucomicrobiota bacterium]
MKTGNLSKASLLTALAAPAAVALLAIGLATTAQAQVVPYTADSHTLHLYHFDETSANIVDYGNGYGGTKINLWPNNIPSLGAAAYDTGFGTSLNVAQALAVKGGGAVGAGPGTGTTPVNYGDTQFRGADGSFTYEVYLRLNQISSLPYNGNGQAMILGHDGQNGNRNWDLKQTAGNTIMFASNADISADQVTFTIPTAGANAWAASAWFHLAVTFDGPTKVAKMYWTKLTPTLTGANLVATKTLQDAPQSSSSYFSVGAGARSWPGRYIDGYLDEVRISDIARAPSDMLPLAAVTSPPDATNSLVAAAPTTVPADDATTSTVTVTLRDATSSPVAGKTVTLVSSRPSLDTVSAASGPSSGTGVVTFTVKSSTPGSSTYTATDTDDIPNVVVTATATVIFTGPPDAGNSTVAAAPSAVPANGSSTSIITVTLKDVNSNPVAGKSVTLTSDRGATDTISAASGVSDASGVVTFTVKSSTPGTPNFTATDSTDSVTVTAPVSVTFTVIPPADTALSTVTASPSTQVANGTSTATITVTLLDSGSNPVSGKIVTLASDRGATDTIAAASGPSTLAGVVTFTVKSSTAGVPVFTATDTTDSVVVTATASVTFTWPPLVARAGAAKTVATGFPATLGGSPTASGGNGDYTYVWTPDDGSLSSTTAANPIASPTVTTTYTVTVTDSVGSTPATSSVTVTYTVPNPNLVSVDFKQGSGTPCAGDTTLTGTTMKNASGNMFSGQVGNWNPLNIGTYNNNSATSGFLTNGGGTATSAKLALGLATGLDATAAGGGRCNPNEGAPGGVDQLRAEEAYLYNGVITGDHYAWAFTGLSPSSIYKLVFFGDLGNASGASNVANGAAGVRDSEGDWNWDSVITDASGTILGTFTAPNPTLGLYGAQLEFVSAA